LIGEESMRGKGIKVELKRKLTEYVFDKLEKGKIILNVFSWN